MNWFWYLMAYWHYDLNLSKKAIGTAVDVDICYGWKSWEMLMRERRGK